MSSENVLLDGENGGALVANTPYAYNNKGVSIGTDAVEIGDYDKVEIQYLTEED